MRTVLLLLWIVWGAVASGQNFVMNGSPVTACQGNFYDSGGSTGNYGNNQNLTTVICSGNGSGAHIRLSFAGVDLREGDALCFYDGPSASAPLLACAAEYPPNQPFIVQATAANTSGCLTAVFTSDGAGTAAGWSAVISCVASCQTIEADIVATQPTALPTDTGWIDICPGQVIAFSGAGQYPQNGLQYAQSDATATFEWQFGDGDVSNGPTAAHQYPYPGGYLAKLYITDAKGCRSTNFASRRIRVAPRPVFQQGIPLPNPVCAGDTLHLSAIVGSLDLRKNLAILPAKAAFLPVQSRFDSLSLPDGIGTAYQTGILLAAFGPDQTLSNINDLEQICINIEHSWARDLEIKIICPNGQSAVLHNFAGREGNKILLGEPNDNDVVSPLPGKGYDYCWTPTATRPPWLQSAAALGNAGTLPAGNYQSAEPLGNLIGCPLNGEWNLRITDLWQSDNGFIFSWGLQFKNSLYRQPEQFTPVLQNGYWHQQSSLIYYTADSIVALPRNAGTAAFQYTIADAFGCIWDTTLTTRVLPPAHPDCLSCKDRFPALRDTVVCAGEPVVLNVASIQPDTFNVQFDAFPNYALGHTNHPTLSPYTAPLEINSLGYNSLTNPALQIKNICVDITTDRASDLTIALRAPDGKLLELSSSNGGSGANYIKTCFAPGAGASIVGVPAPLTGVFQPEGNWNVLTGAPASGIWQLLVSDAAGVEMGVVNAWSIQFQAVNPVQYTWDNTPALSCTDCPNPTATTNQTTTYRVSMRDAVGCMTRDSATIAIQTLLAAPGNLEVQVFGTDFMTWHWNPVPGAAGYEVRIAGGAWQMPNAGLLSHTVGGLAPGDIVEIEVRALSSNAACTPTVAGASQKLIVCTLTATVDSVRAVRCAGAADGSAFISLQNAQQPVLFYPNGMGTGVPSGNLTGLFEPGIHTVIIRDGTGCRDTVSFAIPEPMPLTVTATATAARCNSEKSGSATAVAVGGTGTIQYAWRACTGGLVRTGATVNNVAAGCYSVTATDVNGCTAVNTTTITEPPGLRFQVTTDSVQCFGGADGRAEVVVTGGTPGYQYAWGNGTSTATVSGLVAGVQVLRIQDALGCNAVTTFFVGQPRQLVIDSTAVTSPLCFGDSTGSASVFASGGTGPYQFQWSNQQTTQAVAGLKAGSYSVTIRDAKNCPVVTAVSLVNPTPISFVFSNVLPEQCVTACNGSARISTIGGTAPYQLLWNNVSIATGDTTAQNICPNNWPLTVTDKNGCKGSDTLRIAAAQPLILNFNSTNPTCAGIQNGTGAALVNGGQPPYRYRWSTGSTAANLTGLPCGDYGITVTDANNCTISDTLHLSCLAVLNISAITAKSARCFGQSSGEVTVTPQGGTLPYQYLWNDPNRQVDSSAMNLAAGTYTVTISDARGCSITATEVVTEPDPVLVTIVPTDARCFAGSDGQARAQVTGGRMPYFYEWSNNQTDSVLTGVGSGNYSLTVRDANGCLAPVGMTSVGQPPTPVKAAALQIKKACFGLNDGKAVARAVGGVGGPYTVQWSNGQTDSLLTGLSAGMLRVTISDRNGCSDTASVQIERLTRVEINLISVPTSCYDRADGLAILNLLTGGDGSGDTTRYQYQWSVPNPGKTYASGLAKGRYFITVTDQQGCFATDSIDVAGPLPIKPRLAAADAKCFGQSDGVVTVASIDGNHTITAYQWSNGATTQRLSGVAAGNYAVTVRDAAGCTGSDTVTVREPLPLLLRLEPSVLRCSGDTTGFITAFAAGGTPGYQFLWSNGRSGAVARGLGFGNYVVTVTDQNGCMLSDTVTIGRPDSLEIRALAVPPLCFGGDNGRITLEVSGGTGPYRYNINDGAWGGSPVFLRLKASEYTVRVFDVNGCISSAKIAVSQPPPVVVDLPPDTTLVPGDSLNLSADLSNPVGTVRYRWSSTLADTIRCIDVSACSEVQVRPLYSNTYRLTATDANGCTGTDFIKIKVEKPRGIFVPSGFSPNGDGQNDLLVVHGEGRQVREIIRFRVYDRWGELVWEDKNFQVNDLTRGWDGTLRGGACDPGLFIWVLEALYLDGYRAEHQGEVLLIR